MNVASASSVLPVSTDTRLTARRRAWLAFLLGPFVVAPLWITLLGGLDWAPALGTWSGCVTVLLVATVAYTDTRWRKIPNWATYSAFLWAVVLNAVGAACGQLPFTVAGATEAEHAFWQPGSLGNVGLGACLGGGVLCFVVLFLIYRLSKGGAGDVKLAAALGALLGPVGGFEALVYAYVVAGVTVLAWAIWTLGPVYLLAALGRRVGSFVLPLWVTAPSSEQKQVLRRPVSLGLFFALGTLAVLLGVDLL